MDFNKLQHTLYDLDPTDPQEELKKLHETAQQPPSPESTVDYVNETYDAPSGSMPVGIDSIDDFAALAGVTRQPVLESGHSDYVSELGALAGITEGKKHKKGSKGQAKGSDPMPKTSKPSTTGEQPHPLHGKLVGEDTKDAFKAGMDDYNTPGAITKAMDAIHKGDDKESKDSQKSTKRSTHSSREEDTLPKGIEKYATALHNISQNPELERKFDELMKIADPNLAATSKEKRQQTKKQPARESASNRKSSIKEDLERRLRNKR